MSTEKGMSVVEALRGKKSYTVERFTWSRLSIMGFKGETQNERLIRKSEATIEKDGFKQYSEKNQHGNNA